MIASGDSLFFDADDGENGRELWTYPLYPALDAVGNGLSISSSQTVFGDVSALGDSRTITFTIQNTGTDDVVLNGSPLINIEGANAEDFEVTSPPETSLGAGTVKTFEITFRPSAVGLRLANVNIAYDQDGGRPLSFWIYGIGVGMDFGDAPSAVQSGFASSYPTSLADDSARHQPVGPKLGSYRDSETTGTSNINADGDDTTGGDEDGVKFVTSLVVSPDRTTTASVAVNVSNATGITSRLDAWIDFNRDGDWLDPGEQIAASFDLGTGNGSHVLSFTVPAGAGTGTTYARFRLSTSGGLTPTGSANDGEVEDYAVALLAVGNAASVNLQPSGIAVVQRSGDEIEVRQGGVTLLAVADAVGQALTIVGSAADNTIEVIPGFATAVIVSGNGGSDLVKLSVDADVILKDSTLSISSIEVLRWSSIEAVELSGGDGPNLLDASSFSASVMLRGGGGNDTIIGSNFDDAITGGAGDDSISAGGGKDRLIEEIAAPNDPAVVTVVKLAPTTTPNKYTMTGLGADTIADIE